MTFALIMKTSRSIWMAGLLVGLCSEPIGPAGDAPTPLTADEVRAVQTAYRSERAAVEKDGIAAKFSVEVLRRADQLAQQGDAALAGGQLVEALRLFREARWQLPSLPSDFPSHVTRVLGSFKLRHAHYWIRDVSYSSDGRWIATAGQDGVVKVWEAATGRELSAFRGHTAEARTVRFSPDGKKLLWTSTRDGRQPPQLWMADFTPPRE